MAEDASTAVNRNLLVDNVPQRNEHNYTLQYARSPSHPPTSSLTSASSSLPAGSSQNTPHGQLVSSSCSYPAALAGSHSQGPSETDDGQRNSTYKFPRVNSPRLTPTASPCSFTPISPVSITARTNSPSQPAEGEVNLPGAWRENFLGRWECTGTSNDVTRAQPPPD